MSKNSGISEGTLVYTDDQTKGKGQRGNVWLSEPSKNILMSILLHPKFLQPSYQFYLNLVVGLAIVDALKEVTSKGLLLKWPNDVYLNGRKICGILIESSMRGSLLESSVVGIGLNVNQRAFNSLFATSLFLEEAKDFDRIELIESILLNLEKWYLKLKNNNKEEILNAYHDILMWRGEVRRFRTKGEEFDGEIVGVNNQGQLTINTGKSLDSFGIKEVEFLR